jgi:hypothetical protein
LAQPASASTIAAGASGSTGLLREKLANSSAFVTVAAPAAASYTCVATDPAGDVFLTDGARLFERAAGQAQFAPVNVTVPAGAKWSMINGPQAITADAAGDVFAAGSVSLPTTTTTTVKGRTTTTTTYTSYGAIFEMKAGQTAFGVVYRDANPTSFSSNSFEPWSLAVIDTGPSAGLYSVDGAGFWTVRKSTDGGATWNVIDSFNYDRNIYEGSIAYAVVGDSSGATGNLYVTGSADQRVITGYTTTKVKGVLVQKPVYEWYEHWLTRRSTDGGATWTTVDDFQQPAAGVNEPCVAADLNGTVYVAGAVYAAGPGQDAVVRSNVGGTWHTEDYFANANNYAVAIDPVTATPYAGGESGGGDWFVRSGSAPATFSSTAIAADSTTLPRPIDYLFGSAL